MTRKNITDHMNNHKEIDPHTWGMIFFSIASLNSGGGGRSRPSIRNGTLDVSLTTLSGIVTLSASAILFCSSLFSILSRKGLLWTSFTTSNSPYSLMLIEYQNKIKQASIQERKKNTCMKQIPESSHGWCSYFFFSFEYLSFACSIFNNQDMNSTYLKPFVTFFHNCLEKLMRANLWEELWKS